MKKQLFAIAAISAVAMPALAGGYVTNTNQSAAYLRTLARSTTSDIDAVYFNPAGLVWNEHEGFALQLNIQTAKQNRNILADYTLDGKNFISKKYEGEVFAPVIPSLYATYKTGDFVWSGSFSVVGGGGTCEFSKGLAMFDMLVQSSALQSGLTPNLYDITSSLDGSKIIYGVQLGGSYKINEWLSGYVGARLNYVAAGYKGNLSANLKTALPNGVPTGFAFTTIDLDCEQNGMGVTPIIGLTAKYGKWSLNAKYEYNTSVELENDTKSLVMTKMGQEVDAKQTLGAYADGVKTDADIPGILSVAAGYEILPNLRAAVEFHNYFDEQSTMANDRQDLLDGSTKEYLASLEWDLNKKWTVSAGYQYTSYDGLTDAFQSDTDFFCNATCVGAGFAYNISEKMRLNLGYMHTFYEDYKMNLVSGGNKFGTKTYERTNSTFGISLDYKF